MSPFVAAAPEEGTEPKAREVAQPPQRHPRPAGNANGRPSGRPCGVAVRCCSSRGGTRAPDPLINSQLRYPRRDVRPRRKAHSSWLQSPSSVRRSREHRLTSPDISPDIGFGPRAPRTTGEERHLVSSAACSGQAERAVQHQPDCRLLANRSGLNQWVDRPASTECRDPVNGRAAGFR